PARHPGLSLFVPYTPLFRSRLVGAGRRGLRRRADRGCVRRGSVVLGQPFTPLSTTPSMIWRWKMMNAISTGTTPRADADMIRCRSEEHTSELQSREMLVCRL